MLFSTTCATNRITEFVKFNASGLMASY